MSALFCHFPSVTLVRKLARVALALFYTCFSLKTAIAQELPRRVYLGAHLALVSHQMVQTAGLPDTLGVLVADLAPNTPAARAGLQAGDVLLAVNGTPLAGVPSFMSRFHAAHPNDKWTLTVRRAGKTQKLTSRLEGRPLETNPAFAVRYETVRLPDGSRRRTIVALPPAPGRKPAILFMGGVGCYSLDWATSPLDSYHQLLDGLAKAGFVTCRVEKSGMGDSEGPACESIDFETETAGYRAALAALRTRPDVDPERIFLLGHSIGGLIAPVLAGETPVRGAIAIETAGLPWYEYMLVNLRRQLVLRGASVADVDETMRAAVQANYAFFVENQSIEQIEKAHPGWSQLIELPMSAAYIKQVARLDPATLWTKAARPALFVAGGTDFVTSAEEHHALADALNQVKAGLGSFAEVPELDHMLGRSTSKSMAYQRMTTPGPPTPFNTGVLDAVLTWLNQQKG